jgi:superfamily II DNA or RNA helicase
MVYFKHVKRRLDRSIEDLSDWLIMAVILRDYQKEALNAVIKNNENWVTRQLIVLPSDPTK